LQTETKIAAGTPKEKRLIKSLANAIKAILAPPNEEEQRVATDVVIESPTRDDAPIWTIPRISDAPTIMQTRDPLAKQNLITTARIHCRQTRNNTPEDLPKITRAAPALIQPVPSPPKAETQRSTRVRDNASPVIIIPPYRMLGEGTLASTRLISQRALTAMTLQEALTMPISFTPRKLVPPTYTESTNYAHFAAPMIHPTTGKISPATNV
jgi:hypothetical protein